jgi:glycosyltransferase involved in cell wall biosynthesis
VPSVSIILPTFNRRRFLEAAVESVFAQTYTDWELIIADDGSGEETRTYLRSIDRPQVRTLWLAHSGNPARVRNAAIENATGQYLAFLDSDDLWAPVKLEKQIQALHDCARAGWSYTNSLHIDANGRVLVDESLSAPTLPQGWIFEAVLRLQVSISMPTVVAARELIRDIGAFDDRQRFGEWQDLCLRLALQSEVVALPESLCSVRLHDQHYSEDQISAQRAWMRLYEKMAKLAPTPTLRAYCARMRADTSLALAWHQGEEGEYAAAVTTLRQALPFAWRYPRWWWGALRRVARPAVPQVLVSALRRPRGGTASK